MDIASTNPARFLQVNDRGVLEPGKRADIILFTLDDFQISIQETWVKGKLVYKNKRRSDR